LSLSESDERAIYLEGGTAPRRMELCTCQDAMAMATVNGLAVVAKTWRSGPSVADVPAGG